MSFPEHILIVNVFFAPYSYGGATVVAEQVARDLVQTHGRRVSAISAMTRPDLAAYTVLKVEKNGVQNYVINLPHGRSYAEMYSNPRVTEIMAGLLDTLQPDLLHAHCLQDLGVGILGLAKRRGLPVVLSVHDFWWLCEHQFMIRPNQRYCGQYPVQIEACRGCVDHLPHARLRQEVLFAEAAQADVITFPSQFAHDLSTASGLSAPRLAVWENGVRLPGPAFFEAQAERRAGNDQLVFGHIGGPSQIKGWPVVKSTFETLERSDFAGLLVEATLDGNWWRGQDISKMKGDWSVHPRFDQNNMDAFYAKIDVLLFLSQWKETFGLAIREALARGIRVIQTDSGGTAEWNGADRSDMLQIGDGPKQLHAALKREFDRADQHPAPRPVASYADQAKAFLKLVAPLGPVEPKRDPAPKTKTKSRTKTGTKALGTSRLFKINRQSGSG